MTQRRVMTVPCPHCLARAGRPCRSRRGRPGPAHKARIMSAYHVMVRETPLPPQAAPEHERIAA